MSVVRAGVNVRVRYVPAGRGRVGVGVRVWFRYVTVRGPLDRVWIRRREDVGAGTVSGVGLVRVPRELR